MEKILVFKTATDRTMRRLFQDLGKVNIDCLIQSSQVNRYKTEYPHIYFIDICREGFYDLPPKVVRRMRQKNYDEVYVTFSGTEGYNYGNVMELVAQVKFRRAFFYNCNGERIEIPKKNVVKNILCGLYVEWTGFIYRLKDG